MVVKDIPSHWPMFEGGATDVCDVTYRTAGNGGGMGTMEVFLLGEPQLIWREWRRGGRGGVMLPHLPRLRGRTFNCR